MYKCCDCGREFDELCKKTELIGEYLGTPAYEEYNACPYCESDETTELDRCACGGYKSITENYCNDCENFVNSVVNDFIDSVQQYLHISYKDAVQIILDDMERR